MPSGTPTTPSIASTRATTTSEFTMPPHAAGATSIMSANGSGTVHFDDVLRWDENDVSMWLQSVRLAAHCAAFARNDISGAVLFDIDHGFLKEMGIASVGDCIRISRAIKNLKKRCVDTDSAMKSANMHSGALYTDGHWSNEGEGTSGNGIAGARSSSLHHAANDGSASSPSPGGRGTPTFRDMRAAVSNNSGWTLARQRVDSNSANPAAAQPHTSAQRLTATSASDVGRPSTATGGSLQADSPTSAQYSSAPRPSTSEGARTSSTALTSPQAAALSPIAESRASPSSLRGQPPSSDLLYRGASGTPLALDDVKKKTIKFIGEDGTTKVVPVADCRDAYDVLGRVLRKFAKPATGNSYVPTAGQMYTADEDLLDNDDGGELWGIFAADIRGQTKYLTDNELLAICHAPQPYDPFRERGLLLRRISKGDDPGKRPTAKRSKLESFFGVSQEKITGASPFGPPDDHAGLGHVTTEGKRMNRASTMSILSGLGVNAIGGTRNGKDVPRDSVQRSPPAVSMLPKKARNFFGQRPPSELISSHLTDYFPATEKRVLERTARRSIYGRPSTSIRSKRDSTWSFAADLDAPPLPSKDGGGSAAPAILIGMDSSDADAAGQGQTGALTAPSVRSSIDEWSMNPQPGVPSGSSSGASLRHSAYRPTSYRRTSGESSRSRQSLATKLRMARGISGADENFFRGAGTGVVSSASRGDRSETASLLTVDEITQEVENRRDSMSTSAANSGWVVDEDGVPIPLPPSNRHTLSSSVAGSTRASSHRSVSLSTTEDDYDERAEQDDGASDAPQYSDGHDADITHRPNADAPGEETDRHLGDPMAVSRASDDEEPSDGLETDEEYGDEDDEDDDVSDEEGDGEGGVYQSAAPGREPIKWIKGALIGAGSFGNVFLGMNGKNGLLMAVKQVELPSGDSHNDKRKKSMLEALEREIELLKTLQHDNIVQYLDSYADGTHLNIFLEYVPGGSVAALLRNYGAFEEQLVRNFVKQILHGLSFLHSRDIVHRDIKGANILVDNKSCIKISDFGISKKTESVYVTHRPSLQGSVFWMAPEVVKQTSYTRKADIWSLGCLVVEMISGTHPWANLNQMQALYQIGSLAKPAMPDEVSPEAVEFLNKTFELDHNMRPTSDELLEYPFITDEFTMPDTSLPGNGASEMAAPDESSATRTKGKSASSARKTIKDTFVDAVS